MYSPSMMTQVVRSGHRLVALRADFFCIQVDLEVAVGVSTRTEGSSAPVLP